MGTNLSLPSLKLTILQIFLYIIIPLGPLYSRIVDFKGSTDKPWLFVPIFNLFPLSIVSVLAMAFGYVEPGNGGVPYDGFMWIPIIIRIFVEYFCSMFVSNSILASMLILTFSIGSIMIPNVIRKINQCQEKSLNMNQIKKITIDSVLELGCGTLFSSMLSFIPFIGIIFKIIEIIPILGSIVSSIKWSFGFLITYIAVNMFDQSNMNNYCHPSETNPSDIAKLVIGLLFTLIGTMIASFGLNSKIKSSTHFL